ncbi:helix-turn-helix transcriptional regulator [Castellaniella defragrans]|uniref:AraC family transcriptional activator of pyochelin receptor n=1 Tax=Castellaniella defragrans TaxID=75697 RepID=A0A7W9TMS1_CASDE|nr:AraC family transcriptional regulator [Castellaniella defragrans]KAB0622400.1 helix-turn-helix transcriptional regulator [Castellaniella defragrans]MBB6083573.1 AraC family transcriptional activator of pyochelin receptor [Castellaniella defragrans]
MAITLILPSKRGHAGAPPGHDPDVSHFDASVKLVAGILHPASEDWHEEPLEQGVKLVLVQSGEVRCSAPGQAEHCLKGPSLCFIANEGESSTRQRYGRDAPLRYTIVRLGREILDRDCGLLPQPLLPRGGGPRLLSCPASRALQALAAQIATCPLEGGARDFYLGGKALELAALGTQLLCTESGRRTPALRVTSSDVERVHAARDLLFGALRDPPSLEALAVRVGTNPRKLTAGFRQVFGTSVFALLAEHRLREAHKMLCDEEASVSTVAYRVGYSPAHFSVAFRKRYGVSPSELRAVDPADACVREAGT